MKFNVEIDIDWVEEGGSLNEEIKFQIIDRLSGKLEDAFLGDASKKMSQAAEKLITAKTELLINTVLENPVVIDNGWKDKQEYPSIFDMVEQKMTALYEGKLNVSGQCTKDPLLSNIEKYVANEVGGMLQKISRKVESESRAAAKKAVDENSLVQAVSSVIESAESN